MILSMTSANAIVHLSDSIPFLAMTKGAYCECFFLYFAAGLELRLFSSTPM